MQKTMLLFFSLGKNALWFDLEDGDFVDLLLLFLLAS